MIRDTPHERVRMLGHRHVETPRLLLRPVCEDDVPSLFAIQGDREAMRHTYAAPSLEECGRRLRMHEESRSRLGFAPWAVLDRREARVIGWGGLGVDPLEPGWGVEVSYFLHPACWGRSFATELVRASLELAFENLSLPEVGAFAAPDNGASIRVLEKCGFELLRYEPRLGRNHYAIRAPSRKGPTCQRFGDR